MKYLFFDVECANPKFNSVCTFGYVLTDENFGELAREDIRMNPETSFDRYVIKNILHYSEEELGACMPFPCFYDDLHALLCGKDTVVLGFSISNDIRFLNGTCIRYRLPCLDFRFYDVQKIFDAYNDGDKTVSSIETAGEKLHLEKPQFVHRSDEDARITMEILKAVCRDKGMTLSEILADSPKASGKNQRFLESWEGCSGGVIDHRKNHFKRIAEQKKKKEEKQNEREASSGSRNVVE